VWDVFTGNIIRKFMGHDQQVNCVSYNNFYNVLVSGSYDSTVKIWDMEARNSRPLQTLFDFQDSVTDVCVTSDQIIASSVDENLRIYDIRFGKLRTHNIGAPINGLYACGDDDFVFCTTTDNKIFLYDKSEESIIATYSGAHTTSEFKASVRLTTDNSMVLSTSEDGNISYYDIISKKPVDTFSAHSKPVVSMDLFSKSEYGKGSDVLLVGSLDKTITVWAN
jgi:mitogen-activated protein kinase organizer 1